MIGWAQLRHFLRVWRVACRKSSDGNVVFLGGPANAGVRVLIPWAHRLGKCECIQCRSTVGVFDGPNRAKSCLRQNEQTCTNFAWWARPMLASHLFTVLFDKVNLDTDISSCRDLVFQWSNPCEGHFPRTEPLDCMERAVRSHPYLAYALCPSFPYSQ